MPDPSVRIDREWLNKVELGVAETLLYRMADMVDALTLTKSVYGQILLPPDEAQAKKEASNG